MKLGKEMLKRVIKMGVVCKVGMSVCSQPIRIDIGVGVQL